VLTAAAWPQVSGMRMAQLQSIFKSSAARSGLSTAAVFVISGWTVWTGSAISLTIGSPCLSRITDKSVATGTALPLSVYTLR